MKNVYKTFVAAMAISLSGVGTQAQTNLAEGWFDAAKSPADCGWTASENVTFGASEGDVYYCINVQSPVYNGTAAMLYTKKNGVTLSNTLSLGADKVYQVSSSVWRRNGGDTKMTVDYNISDQNANLNVWTWEQSISGNNKVTTFSQRFTTSEALTDAVFSMTPSVTSNWQDAGWWNFSITELGDKYTLGWDAEGSASTTPYDAGWRCSDAALTDWTNQYKAGAYRDDLEGIDRVFIHQGTLASYSYPIKGLKAGVVYTISAKTARMNGSCTSTFSINTAAADASVAGEEIVSAKFSTPRWAANGGRTGSLTFVVPADGDYYFTWAADNAGDRLLIGELQMAATNTAETLSGVADGALATMSHIKLEGEFSADNMNTLAAKLGSNSVLTSVDLTEATIADGATDVFAACNPNALKFFAESATVPTSWSNAVKGAVAESITLVDGHNFNNPKAFTATSISYKRTFVDANWFTMCLPFAMSDIASLGTVEGFKAVNETTISFEQVNAIAANTPYIIKPASAGETTFSASSVEVPVSAVTEGEFLNNFTAMAAGEAIGKMILVNNDNATQSFKKASEKATIPAFRGYLEMPAEVAEANVLHFPFEVTSINEGAQEQKMIVAGRNGALIITASQDVPVVVTALNGMVVAKKQLKAGETMTVDGLRSGLYMVNDEKVVIK